ncbi:MAG: M14 family zinc carboxypeptidase [Pseudomonadota bacterium]
MSGLCLIRQKGASALQYIFAGIAINPLRHLIYSGVVSAFICGLTLPAYGKVVSPPAEADWCKRLTVRLPGISEAHCQSAALVPTGVKSSKGFPILARDILPVPPKKGGKGSNKEPIRVLLLGGIHGDELTSSAIVFQWLKSIRGPIAQDFHWKVAPVVNPDGLLAPTPTRVNANGVDLNRNFPMPDWLQQVPRYWTKVTRSDPRRFPGAGPLSEPESRWVNDEILRFRPHVIISIHAPFGLLDFDGPTTPPRHFGRLLFTPVGVYPGSLGNYGGQHVKVPIITIELPNSLVMPPDAEVQRIWQDMLTWIRRNASKRSSSLSAQSKATLVPPAKIGR